MFLKVRCLPEALPILIRTSVAWMLGKSTHRFMEHWSHCSAQMSLRERKMKDSVAMKVSGISQ